MLKNTFAFLEGIGPKTEKMLINAGILSWDDFLSASAIRGISQKRKSYYDIKLRNAKKAALEGNAEFFANLLPQREMWRLYPMFRDSCIFLDIEVDSKGKIILLTLFNRFETKTLVGGIHLDKATIESQLSNSNLLITYNGSAFDVPKLKQQLGVTITIPHLDLKPLCQRLGLKGGLKYIEHEIRIHRPPHLHGRPVDAWKSFLASGDREYLDLLVQYNQEDAVNLYQLIEKCLTKLENQKNRRLDTC